MAQLGIIRANLPGAIADVDSEFLHDLRVAIRRSRSLQRQLKGVFPPGQLARFRADFRWLQRATGPGRDFDVALLELGDLADLVPPDVRPDLAPVGRLLDEERRRARPALVRALHSTRTRTLLEDWAGALEELVALPVDDRPDAERAVADVAGRRILAVRGHLIRGGAAIGPESPAEALHDLRKTGKELRYLLESFAGLYPADVVKPMVRALKALQDTLGRFQDRQVQADLFISIRDELAAADGGPAALMALGLLLDRLGRERDAARAEFAERFAAFAAAPTRRVLAATFG
jgi:CHAD domain-containing protein